MIRAASQHAACRCIAAVAGGTRPAEEEEDDPGRGTKRRAYPSWPSAQRGAVLMDLEGLSKLSKPTLLRILVSIGASASQS